MAGPLTIQRVPRGLLHALGMKGTGEFPHELTGNLFASFDSTVLYLNDLQRTQFQTTSNINTAGVFQGATSIQVPTGELWLMTNVSCYCSVLAAGNTNWKCQAGYVRKTAFSAVFEALTPMTPAAVTGDSITVGTQLHPGDLVLAPNDSIAVMIHASATATFAANTSFTLIADYYRLEF